MTVERSRMDGVSALVKKTQSSLTPPALLGHREKTAVYEPESRLPPDTKSVGTSIPDFPAFRTRREKFLWSVSLLAYGSLLKQLQQAKTLGVPEPVW